MPANFPIDNTGQQSQGEYIVRQPVRFAATPYRSPTDGTPATALARVAFTGDYIGPGRARVTITQATAAAPDTFDWSIIHESGRTLATAAGVAVTGAAQVLAYGISVTFSTTTGGAVGDYWVAQVANDALRAHTSVAGGIAFESRGNVRQLGVADSEAYYEMEAADNDTATNASRMALRRARGTLIAPLIVQNGDRLGVLDFVGFDGSAADATADSSWLVAARILATIGAAPGAGDMPGQLDFQVTADGAATPSTALSIAPSGAITIGGTLSVGALDVGGGYAGGSGSTLDTLGNGQFNGNVTVDGNLTVSGTLSQLDVDNIITEDPLISLGRSNAADLLDLGVYAQYNDGTERFTGLFRDATDGVWKLFDTLTAEPTTTVNTGGAGYDHGDLRVGGLTIDDNAQFSAGANHTVDVAAEAADTAGRNLSIAAGAGGIAVAAAGGVGGTLNLSAAAGGAGAAAQLAGAGGPVVVAGGAAGADGGGGGAAGGDLSLRGGNASGAGVDGVVRVGDANTSSVVVTPASTFSAVADFDSGLTLAANQNITGDGSFGIRTVAGAFNVTIRSGDAAGVQGVSFTDSADAQVAFLTSNGTLRLAAGEALDTLAAGALNIGPTNATSVLVTPAATFSAVADFNLGQTIAAGQRIRGDGALTVDVAPAANDVAGAALSIASGAGGAAVAAPGGLGGQLTLSAASGGAGAAAQLAGAGGVVVVSGGAAGADGGGGGAAGGNLSLRGGNASGAGVDGAVNIGDANTSAVVITPATTLSALADFDAGQTIAAGQSILGDGALTVGVVAGAFNLTLRMGDNAGGQSVLFQDSDNATVASINSNGFISTATTGAGGGLDTLAAGNLRIGPSAATSVTITPPTTFSAVADFNAGATVAAGQSIRGDGALTVDAAAAAAEAAGVALAVTGGAGGITAGVASGGVGGQAGVTGGAGGAGDAARAAGAGGVAIVRGGDAGAAGAGGGGAGGDLSLRGGNASGAATDGVVRIGDLNTSSVVVTPATTFSAAADFDAGATVAAGQSILGDGALTVGVVDGAFNLTLQMGDAAGVQGVSFEDSADVQVAFLTSDGDLRVLAGSGLDTLAAGQLDLGSTNATSIVATPAVICTTSVAAGAGANMSTLPGSGTTGVTYGGALRPRRSIVLGAREGEDGSASTAVAVAVANSKAYWSIGLAGAPGTDESVRFAFVMPDWAADSEDILIALYTTDNVGAGGNLVWRIDSAVRDNAGLLTDALSVGTQTAAMAMVATANALRIFGHTSSTNAVVTDANLVISGGATKGDLVEFEVRRVASDGGDSLGNDIRLWKVHVELLADRA